MKHLIREGVVITAIILVVGSALGADLPLRPVASAHHRASSHRVSAHSAPARISLPEPELLERQAAPECEFKASEQADKYDVALRVMKLDFEQQCYRQSESILRARMERLQDAVSKTIESINLRDRASSPGNERSDRRGACASTTAGE
jgi:hypothetical protein